MKETMCNRAEGLLGDKSNKTRTGGWERGMYTIGGGRSTDIDPVRVLNV